MKYRIQSLQALRNCLTNISRMDIPQHGWLIQVDEYDPLHTDQQRRLLWATWRDIADHIAAATGQRFTDQDVHDWVLASVFGWHEVEINGRTISRPQRTITKPKRMSREHMSEVIAATDQLAAEHGCLTRVAA